MRRTQHAHSTHRPARALRAGRAIALGLAVLSALPAAVPAQTAPSAKPASGLPPPPAESAMADWAFPWADDVPGVLSAADLLEKPAGKHGPVVARDGHFYTGDRRIKFVGVNFAFAGNFPAKEQADALAKRLAAFGVNVVRFHHMDNQPFPSGIFADKKLEALSPEALDRLDYFISALKQQGVYANLNLHVSRPFSRTNHWPAADKLEGYDKQVDIFHPALIAANKRYAKDLLTHVNAYTKTRYADEPAVAAVEINNEDTLFLWGGEQKLAELPEPYAGILQKQWNEWLAKKYGGKEKLAAAWGNGAEPLGDELIPAPPLDPKKWLAEQHGAAKMTVGKAAVDKADGPDAGGVRLDVKAVDGTDWHLQFGRPGLALTKGKFYTLQLKARADQPRKLGVGVSMAHAPWGNLGLTRSVELKPEWTTVRLGFVAGADDANARVQLTVGGAASAVELTEVSLRPGGREGLRTSEDPAAGSVTRGGLGGADAPVRNRDWYAFLQATDEAYFVGMRDWLRSELGVKAPITGTIGLGMLGTKSQSKMDFVDSHAYWDHPHFPRRQWDQSDWEIKNKPMVDDPAGAALWTLAATRVWGKPFTVTEYNHAAPNDWQAECVPMVMAYAAAQDWDAVYLFDYTGGTDYAKPNTRNFFSVEGNVAKMAALPLAARMFHLGVQRAVDDRVIDVADEEALDTAPRHFFQQWSFLRDERKLTWREALSRRVKVRFGSPQQDPPEFFHPAESPIDWSAGGAGTGRFVAYGRAAGAFVGFAGGPMPVGLGVARLTKLESPFAAIQIVAADPVAAAAAAAAKTPEGAPDMKKVLAGPDRLLVSAVARQSAAGMTWNADRTSVGTKWGKSPAKIEVVRGEIELASAKPIEVWALGPDGKRLKQVPATFKPGKGGTASTAQFPLGTEPTVWYEVVRK